MCFIHFIRFIRFLHSIRVISFIHCIHSFHSPGLVFGPPAGWLAATLAARRPAGWLSTTLAGCMVGSWFLTGCLPLCGGWVAVAWLQLAAAVASWFGWLGLWPAGGPGKTDHHRDKGAQPTRPRTAGGRSVLKDLGRSQAKTDHQRENSCRNLFRRIWAPEARSTQGDPFRRIWVAQRPQGATLNNNNAADVRFEGFRPLGSGNGAQTQKKVHTSQTKKGFPT